MNEFVVGVDGSDDSRMALRWAAAAAQAADAPLRAVQAWSYPHATVLPFAPVPLTPDEMDEHTQQAIREPPRAPHLHQCRGRDRPRVVNARRREP